jgi:hypothetical protein
MPRTDYLSRSPLEGIPGPHVRHDDAISAKNSAHDRIWRQRGFGLLDRHASRLAIRSTTNNSTLPSAADRATHEQRVG